MFEKLVVVALVVLLFLGVWRLESGWRIVLTPFLLAMYFELTRVFPAFVLAEQFGGKAGNYALWVAVVAYVSLLAGFVAWYCYPRANPRQALALSAYKTPLALDRADTSGVLAIALVLGVVGLFYFGGLPATVKSSFSLIWAGGDAELANLVSQQRFELTKGAYFGAEYKGQGLVVAFQEVGWTLICVYTLLRHLELRSKGSFILVLAAIAGAWVFVGGLGSRAPLLNIMICMLAAYSLRKPLRLRTMVIAVGAGVTLAIALGLYSSKMYSLLAGALGFGDFITQALARITERILIGNGINDVYAIDLVRAGALEVGYGSMHWRDLVSAIPGVEYGQPFAYKLYLLTNATAHGTTFRSATYLSSVFVDFYWPGVVIAFFLIGVVLAITQRWVLRAAADPWAIAVAVTMAFYVMNLLRGGPVALASSLAVLGALWTVQRIVRLIIREIGIASGTIDLASAGRSLHA